MWKRPQREVKILGSLHPSWDFVTHRGVLDVLRRVLDVVPRSRTEQEALTRLVEEEWPVDGAVTVRDCVALCHHVAEKMELIRAEMEMIFVSSQRIMGSAIAPNHGCATATGGTSSAAGGGSHLHHSCTPSESETSATKIAVTDYLRVKSAFFFQLQNARERDPQAKRRVSNFEDPDILESVKDVEHALTLLGRKPASPDAIPKSGVNLYRFLQVYRDAHPLVSTAGAFYRTAVRQAQTGRRLGIVSST
ncbi:unnamed protein product [Amoebophrya sp. A25]|nr:unnamed protein product [Amoebophrya sp. A25]|eukprot:GSA25T00023166001.1